jgi:hypothetical protein
MNAASCPTCLKNGSEEKPFDGNCPAAWAHRFLPKLVARLSAWYMHDNHTFAKLSGTLDQMVDQAVELASSSPYGMLCPAILLDANEREIRRVGPMVSMGARTPEALGAFRDGARAWAAALRLDTDIARLGGAA